ncbi:hypothetical protein Y1Q_0004595 [Alligator mississippiensis]|uniref:Uncharacterized protein n=1 Tax=Alligator mississippiensis TaxID=8496 RepID=A0A151MHP2_ALLMI|nr:hypothetical protein Y1Q_0004595 [Alligator mississippiensis]
MIDYVFCDCPYTREVWKKVGALLLVVTGYRNLNREAVHYRQLTRQQGTPTAHFDKFISCFRTDPSTHESEEQHSLKQRFSLPVEY